MARRRDIALSRSAIRATAFEMLDNVGLDSLTMRALAKNLNVQAPAIYSYYTDKSELISEMAATYFVEASENVGGARSANQWLKGFGAAFYDILTQRRDAARLFAFADPQVQPEVLMVDEAIAPLTQRGLSPDRAILVQAAVISLALGSALDHSNAKRAEFLGGFFDLQAGFDEALQILADGLVPA